MAAIKSFAFQRDAVIIDRMRLHWIKVIELVRDTYSLEENGLVVRYPSLQLMRPWNKSRFFFNKTFFLCSRIRGRSAFVTKYQRHQNWNDISVLRFLCSINPDVINIVLENFANQNTTNPIKIHKMLKNSDNNNLCQFNLILFFLLAVYFCTAIHSTSEHLDKCLNIFGRIAKFQFPRPELAEFDVCWKQLATLFNKFKSQSRSSGIFYRLF